MAHPYPHPASVVPEVDQAPLQVGPSQQGCWGLGTDELPFFYLPSSAPWPAGFQRALTVTQVTQALSHIGEKDGLGGENAVPWLWVPRSLEESGVALNCQGCQEREAGSGGKWDMFADCPPFPSHHAHQHSQQDSCFCLPTGEEPCARPGGLSVEGWNPSKHIGSRHLPRWLPSLPCVVFQSPPHPPREAPVLERGQWKWRHGSTRLAGKPPRWQL